MCGHFCPLLVHRNSSRSVGDRRRVLKYQKMSGKEERTFKEVEDLKEDTIEQEALIVGEGKAQREAYNELMGSMNAALERKKKRAAQKKEQ